VGAVDGQKAAAAAAATAAAAVTAALHHCCGFHCRCAAAAAACDAVSLSMTITRLMPAGHRPSSRREKNHLAHRRQHVPWPAVT